MDSRGRDYFLDYYQQRQLIGFIGMVLPVVVSVRGFLEFGAIEWPSSISAYAYTHADVFLTACMGAVGVFLLAYRGPNGEDRWYGWIAGIGAIGVAIFQTGKPELLPEAARCFGEFAENATYKYELQEGCRGALNWMVIEKMALHEFLHYLSAFLFLSTLTLLSLRKFTITDGNRIGDRKRKKKYRNWVYQSCGVIMLLMLLLIAAEGIFKFAEEWGTPTLVFWAETVAVAAFGYSWLVKGQRFLRDPHPSEAESSTTGR